MYEIYPNNSPQNNLSIIVLKLHTLRFKYYEKKYSVLFVYKYFNKNVQFFF